MIKKKMILLMLAVFTAASLINAQQLDEAKDLIDEERYASAETILEKNAGDPETNYLLVKVYLEQDKEKEAETFINTHLNNNIKESDPLNQAAFARYMISTGNLQAARELINSILADRKNQKNPDLLLSLAMIMIEEKDGDAREALNLLEMAAKRDKGNAEIDIAKGLAYRKLNDASNAYLSYQSAIKKDPRNARAHYLLGKIFRAQKNQEVYMEHFMNAYSADPNYAPLLEELYNHYYYKDVKEAKKFLEKFIANTDYNVQNDYYLTDILYLNGEYENAIQLANVLLNKEQANAQPRLYKLIAYSYAKAGDTLKAKETMTLYFEKEKQDKHIAADFELMASLHAAMPGMENKAIEYYSNAVNLDSLNENKVKYAGHIIALYKKLDSNLGQAVWLGKLYNWKEKTNNIDLFNWGLAYYKANDFKNTDSVFTLYTTRYPDDIFGHYWRAQANAAIDTAMVESLAVPHYLKVIEIGEQDKVKNSKMLLKAYGYLGGYEANQTKNYEEAIRWFEKYLELDASNEQVKGYIESLKKWMSSK